MSISTDLEKLTTAYRTAILVVLNAQNQDGGWSYDCMSDCSDAWTTAEMLIALLTTACNYQIDYELLNAAEERCVRWIIHHQNTDGGWSCQFYSTDGESTIASTSYCIIALRLYQDAKKQYESIDTAISRALIWIVGRQCVDGGWKSNDIGVRSQIGCTAFAVRALNPYGKKQNYAEYIQNAQYYLYQYYHNGWGFSPLSGIDSTLTNYVIKMLIELEAKSRHTVNLDILRRSFDEMLNTQNPDGSWSDWQGINDSIESTALFVENYSLAFVDVGTNISVEKALGLILSCQRNDGLWPQSAKDTVSNTKPPYWITHNCILALSCYINRITNSFPPQSLYIDLHDSFVNTFNRHEELVDGKRISNQKVSPIPEEGELVIRIPQFKIGFTFTGNYRHTVIEPACNELLRLGYGRNDIFYDMWHQPLVSQVGSDVLLQKIYGEYCDFVVVLLSPDYLGNKWTGGVEWRAIRNLIATRQESRICLLRIDGINIDEIDGLFSNNDIAINIDGLRPQDVAQLIVQWLSYRMT